MEGRGPGERVQDGTAEPLARGWRRDLLLLAVLLAAAAGVRLWLITHTEVAARDSIGYIRYAWHLKHRPWNEVARTSESHPGYPAVVFAVSEVLRPFFNDSDCVLMQFSAQLANSLAGVLLVLPMYFLGWELFGRAVGFWAALLFQVFPASGRILSDGLSEGVFLLFAAVGLWAGVRALRRRSPLDFGLAGLFGGLAYLTRPEGALIVAAIGVVLLGGQLVTAWRQPWPRLLVCSTVLGLAAAAVASPFVLATQRLTTKPTAHILLEEATFSHDGEQGVQAPVQQPVLLASTFAVWWDNRNDSTAGRVRWALVALLTELVKGNYYVAWLAGLVGLWCCRGQLRQTPGAWVLLLLCLMLTLVLWRMAVVVGYLSNRHTLLILLCDIYWVAAGMLIVGRGLAWLVARWKIEVRPRVLGSGLLGLLVLAALPKTLEPLHSNRSGFRDVGLWLAQNAAPTDPVIDPYYWSHYYSGRVFTEGVPLEAPPGHQPTRYVVLERAGLEHARLTLLPEAERLKDQGQLVYYWKGQRPRTRAEVRVYAVPP